MRSRELDRGPRHDALSGLLLYYELGALSAAERAEFEAHALECETCFAELSRGAGTAALLRERRPELARALRIDRPGRLSLRRFLSVPAFRVLAPALGIVVLVVSGSALVRHVLEGRDVRHLATFSREPAATGTLRAPGSRDATDELLDTGAGYLDLGNYQEAIRCFEAALARSPDHAEAGYRLGLARIFSGDIAGAIDPLEGAAEHAGTERELHDRILWTLANAYLALGRRADCERTLRDLAAHGGASGPYETRATELLSKLQR